MSHYHFNVYDGHELIKDSQGAEHATLDSAMEAARERGRRILVDLVSQGKAIETHVFYVGNEAGFTEARFTAGELLGFETHKA
jgi:hypothetical protein